MVDGQVLRHVGAVRPGIVTADEVADPQALELVTTVNGEEMQRTTTALMINPIARLIDTHSLITLAPGDIIATGTPSGRPEDFGEGAEEAPARRRIDGLGRQLSRAADDPRPRPVAQDEPERLAQRHRVVGGVGLGHQREAGTREVASV